MSTLASTPPMALPADPSSSILFIPPSEGSLVFRGVDWHTYNQLSESLGDGQRVHLIYDGKDLEIMVIGNAHEILKGRASKIVNALAMGRRVNYVDSGQATWKTKLRGLEADLSYYFDPEKIRAAKAAFARDSRDPADYPRPDMAIEIDLSPSQVDRPAIYRDLRVFEIWRFTGRARLIIEQLQADGSYAAVAESRFLRIRPEEVIRWLNEADVEPDESAWQLRLTQWAIGLGQQAP
jgi:Uma2 family endonuclease